jgi:predicted ATPase/DNA-binding NarL/FixJ family response regulator
MSAADDVAKQPPVRLPSTLTVPLTTFIGRGPELGSVTELLARHRLVTLVGPGGAGKTRLAAEVARSQASRFADGAFWVDLSHLTDGGQVAEAVAVAIGAPVAGHPLRTLCAFLSDRRSLLCIDNAEHLLDGVADVVAAVLGDCPDATMLVTSREPIGLPGEAVSGIPPMSDTDAVALFEDRARLARQDFVLDETSEQAVRSIAAHLDGIPLALELAAAWMRTLTPAQVEAGLDDRFALLVRGPRGAQRRQLTLAGSIDWSYALLDDVDRAVFRRLSTFAGSFDLAAAQAVCGDPDIPDADTLPSVGRLVDKSLIVVDQRSGSSRYRLLETIRAYAIARAVDAKERDAFRARHLDWCLDFVQNAEQVRERDTDRWLASVTVEYDNLAAALEFGLGADDPSAARRLAAFLAWFWHFDHRGRDGLAYLREAIQRAPDERSLVQAQLLTGLALVADTAEPLDVEYDAAARALAMAEEVGDDGLRALCLNLLAVGAFYTDLDDAWRLCELAHDAAVAGENVFVQGASRALQAMILHLRDRHAEAEALATGSVREALRNHRGILSTLLTYQANGAYACGHLARANGLADEALRIALPLGDYLRLGLARSTLAEIVALRGDTSRAAVILDSVVRLADIAEIFVPGLDQALATLARLDEDPASAIGWLQRSSSSTERGAPTWMAGRALPRLGAALAEAGSRKEASIVLDQAVALCRRLQLPSALAEALSAQAELAAALSDGFLRAAELHHAALAIRVDHGLVTSQLDSLEALARLSALTKPAPESVRLLHAAQSARIRLGATRSPGQQRVFDSTIVLLRGTLSEPAFDEAASSGDALPLDRAVNSARRMRGHRSRPSAGWASLTPTELDVVATIAEGLTNPQIGARLFMSNGTVKTHLSHIYAKLDIANRTQLATAASERELRV